MICFKTGFDMSKSVLCLLLGSALAVAILTVFGQRSEGNIDPGMTAVTTQRDNANWTVPRTEQTPEHLDQSIVNLNATTTADTFSYTEDVAVWYTSGDYGRTNTNFTLMDLPHSPVHHTQGVHNTKPHRYKWKAPRREEPLGCPPEKRFIDDPDYPVTLLVSFPGSGNTWLRHLVETATGIYTGSIYDEELLRREGFRGENYHNNSVIMVKTHYLPNHLPSERAILLIRHPFPCTVAEINRIFSNNHTGFADDRHFHGKLALSTVQRLFTWWVDLHAEWLGSYRKPLHIVWYELLKENPIAEMKKVLTFLEWQVTKSQIKCFSQLLEGKFHRQGKTEQLEQYRDMFHGAFLFVERFIQRLKFVNENISM